MFEPSGSDPIRLWVIGNIAGGEGQGTIYDVKISIVYEDPGTAVTFGLTPSTTSGYNGVSDSSTPGPAVHTQTVDDGSLPKLADGRFIAPHAVYGAGYEWREFRLEDFELTDSPIGDFFEVFPTSFPGADQINVYEISMTGNITDFHIDAYNHVDAGNGIRAVFAPFSHDAGTGINDPFPVPEPGALSLSLVGLLALGFIGRRRWRR